MVDTNEFRTLPDKLALEVASICEIDDVLRRYRFVDMRRGIKNGYEELIESLSEDNLSLDKTPSAA